MESLNSELSVIRLVRHKDFILRIFCLFASGFLFYEGFQKCALNRWSEIRIDVSKQYMEAGWKEPSDLSFILICGATKMVPGNFAGFYQEMRVGAER